jgi:hypothetical protein
MTQGARVMLGGEVAARVPLLSVSWQGSALQGALATHGLLPVLFFTMPLEHLRRSVSIFPLQGHWCCNDTD